MAGILAVAAYVPRYRLPREVIAKEWGGAPSTGGESAVANHDEDSLTLAVNAAAGAAGVRRPPRRRSSSRPRRPPYAEKQGAATIAAVLDLPAVGAHARRRRRRCAPAPRRCCAALDAVARRCRRARPGGGRRLPHGGAGLGRGAELRRRRRGAAGRGRARARRGGRHAHAGRGVARHLADQRRRTSRTRFPAPSRASSATRRLLAASREGRCWSRPGRPRAICATPSWPRRIRARRSPWPKPSGSTPSASSHDTLWTTVGDTGTAQPLVLLAAALERAKPGELILVSGYGDGADAIVLRATGAPPAARRERRAADRGQAHAPVVRTYARFRRLMRKDPGLGDVSTPVVAFRDRGELLPLLRRQVPACGTVQFPRHRVCIECGHRGGLEDVQARAPRHAVHVHQRLSVRVRRPADDPRRRRSRRRRACLPAAHRLRPRARRDRHAARADVPQVHEGGGFHNYFWKARPA